MDGLFDLTKVFGDILGDTPNSLLAKGIRLAEVEPGRMADVLQPTQANTLRRAAGGLFGVDTSNERERLKAALGQLDLQDPAQAAKAVELIRAVDPAAAGSLQAKMQAAQEASALRKAQIEAQQSTTMRNKQATALDKAKMADDITQRDEAKANLEAAKPATLRALSQAKIDNPKIMVSDLMAAVQNNTMSPADVQNVLSSRLQLSTEANEWIKMNNETALQRGTGEIKQVPVERNVTAFRSGNLIIGLDTITGDQVYTKNIADITDPNSPFTDTATTIVPREAAAPLAAPTSSLTPAQVEYRNLLTQKLKESEGLLQQIKQAKGLVGRTSAGVIPNMIRAIDPQTEGDMAEAALGQANTNLKAALNPIVASLGFDELQSMRSDPDNKTGGALGQVSNIELKMLQSAVADLGTEQSPPLLRANLERIERHYTNFLQAELGIVPNIDVDDPIYGGNVNTNDAGDYIIRDPNTGKYWKVGKPGAMMTLEKLQ
jgi:hypothetical protein